MDTAEAFQIVLDYLREAIKGMPFDQAHQLTLACNILEDVAVNEYGDGG